MNNSDLLMLLVNKLDHRKIPQIQVFDPTDEPLKDYFIKFEKYCNDSLNKDKTYWIDELESRLTGDMLECFKALKKKFQNNKTRSRHKCEYEYIKQNLLDWYYDTKDLRKQKAKEKFKEVVPKKSESLYLYSTRLEGLFSQAYSSRDAETSVTLREKFINSIPKKSRSLFTSQVLTKKLKGKTITWTDIQRCARVRDVEVKESEYKEKSDDEVDHTIEINFNQREYEENRGRSRNKYYNSSRNGFVDSKQGYQNGRDWRNMRPPTRNYRGNTNRNTDNGNGRNSYQKDDQNRKFSSIRPPDTVRCYNCNKLGHIKRQCRLLIGPCYNCNMMGHLMRECRNKQGNRRSQSQPPRYNNNNGSSYNSRNRRNSGSNRSNNEEAVNEVISSNQNIEADRIN